MVQNILLVGIGGGIGSILRYLVSMTISRYWPDGFPLGTFLVNISGCLLMGLVLGFLAKMQGAGPEWKLLLATGFCGGYTTFSAFAAENLTLIQSGQWTLAALYITGSIVLGVLAVLTGLYLTR